VKRRLALAGLALLVLTGAALAQQGETVPDLDLDALLPEGEGAFTGRVVQIILLLTVLSLAPGLLIMVTCFTRFIVALSFLRAGLGMQSTPANLILISLALFMTFFVMQPTFEQAYRTGLQPLLENEIDQAEAYGRVVAPFREFMLTHVRQRDLELFRDLAGEPSPGATEGGEEATLRILVPAFMISELRRGFEIGFLIVLPFLVIDLIVATLTMSMGMMMLPPTVISLPFKILFFVLIDGWNMLIGGLVRSFF
jgi:flagellar biosynthetic protein FliP